MAIVSQENILSILTTFNPWWQNGVVPKAFVKEFHRSSYYTAANHFSAICAGSL